MKILVVDDEPHIRRALKAGLSGLGHEVRAVGDGDAALRELAGSRMDVVILDLGLPDQDGVEVIGKLRPWSGVPVVVLSVRGSQEDKIGALEAGADDYVEKPFAMGELVARLSAVVRRSGRRDSSNPATLRFGVLDIDLARQLVFLDGRRVALTRTEYGLLVALATHPFKLLTHHWLLREVWGPGYAQQSQYLRVYIRRLRAKLGDDPTAPRWIGTDPGIGYRWVHEPSER